MANALCSWSGGKDSCLALHRAQSERIRVTTLLAMLHEEGRVSRSHGISREVLEAQARALEKEIAFGAATWNGYEKEFVARLEELAARRITRAVFGDIDLEPHREWEERVCAAVDLEPILPLWGENRRKLVEEFLGAGFEAVVVSVRGESMRHWLGQKFNEEFVTAAEAIGWDACGEGGEFHTFVVDGPIFKNRVEYQLSEVRRVHDHHMVSLEPPG